MRWYYTSIGVQYSTNGYYSLHIYFHIFLQNQCHTWSCWIQIWMRIWIVSVTNMDICVLNTGWDRCGQCWSRIFILTLSKIDNPIYFQVYFLSLCPGFSFKVLYNPRKEVLEIYLAEKNWKCVTCPNKYPGSYLKIRATSVHDILTRYKNILW